MRLCCVLGFVLVACAEGGARPQPSEQGGSLGGQLNDDGVRLPFVVDDHFVAAGPMGDAIGSIENDPNRCLARPEGAQGSCYAFALSAGGSLGWSGLYWLKAPDQWGSHRGVLVEGGARKVTFFAASTIPITAKFLVGGIVEGAKYPDEFSRSTEVPLTSTLTEHEISLDGAVYDEGVQGGFGFTLSPAKDLVIFLDNIRWH